MIGQDKFFTWSVWVSLSEASMTWFQDRWLEDAVADEPSRFGWLRNRLPGYPDTFNLKTAVHRRGRGVRPFIELEPTDHPLAIEQRRCITLDRVEEIAGTMFHGPL